MGLTVAVLDQDLLRERLASHYLELFDRTGRPPRVPEVVRSLCTTHPEYDAEAVETVALSREFAAYLSERRREHLTQTLGARLLAAEWGLGLAAKAAQILDDRIDELSSRELIQLVKIGNELAQKVDVPRPEAGDGGGPQRVQLNQAFMWVSPERAEELATEYIRLTSKQAREARGAIEGTDET